MVARQPVVIGFASRFEGARLRSRGNTGFRFPFLLLSFSGPIANVGGKQNGHQGSLGNFLMKILLVLNTFDSRTTGVARHAHFLQEAFTALGHRSGVLFLWGTNRRLFFQRALSLMAPFWGLLCILFFLFRHPKPDLVCIHTEAAAGYVGLRRFFKGFPPCIAISYGSDELKWLLEKEEERLGLTQIKWISKKIREPFVLKPARYALRHADGIQTASRGEIEFYHRVYGSIPAGCFSSRMAWDPLSS